MANNVGSLSLPGEQVRTPTDARSRFRKATIFRHEGGYGLRILDRVWDWNTDASTVLDRAISKGEKLHKDFDMILEKLDKIDACSRKFMKEKNLEEVKSERIREFMMSLLANDLLEMIKRVRKAGEDSLMEELISIGKEGATREQCAARAIPFLRSLANLIWYAQVVGWKQAVTEYSEGKCFKVQEIEEKVEEIVVKDISKSEVLGVNKKDIEDCILIGGQRKGNKKNVRSKAMMNGRKPRGRQIVRGRRGYGQRGAISYLGSGPRNRTYLTRASEPFSGLPQILKTKLIYYENGYVWNLPSLTTEAKIALALNDPWDPYIPLGGKSANEFYRLMQSYKYCRTNAATISVHVVQPEFASNKAVGLCMYPNWDGDTIANIDDANSLDKSRVTFGNRPTNLIASAISVSRRYFIGDIFNLKKLQYTSRPYSGLTDIYNSGSSYYSPTNLARVEVMVYRYNESSLSEAIAATGSVRIVFEVEFAQKIPAGEYTPVSLEELKSRSEEIYIVDWLTLIISIRRRPPC